MLFHSGATMSNTSDSSPLRGIRVLDLTQYAPGPYASRLMCDLGADVIKVEIPGGDPMQHLFRGSATVSPAYVALNHGKKIVRLNLKDDSAVASVKKLVAAADVLIEGFRPGVMQRLQLGYEDCRPLNPSLVYCSITGYGQSGPYASRAGHDINYCAVAGLLSYTSQPSQYPLIADHSGALNALNQILASLIGRQHSARGCYLDVSLYEPILGWQYLDQSRSPLQPGDPLLLLSGGAACYNLYKTLDDRLVTLGALESRFWIGFCRAVGRPDWVDRQDEDLPQSGLIDEVGELFRSQPLSYWQEWLGDIDCCFEAVPLPHEIYNHPQTVSRGLFHSGKISAARSNLNATEPLTILESPAWKNREQ